VTTAPEGAVAAAARKLIAEAEGSDPGELTATALPGGASRQAFALQAGEGAGRRWMIRRDPPGADESFNPLEVEFRVLQAAAAAGVAVAEPIAYEPRGGRFESAGMLMSFVDGTSVAPRVLRREELAGARRRLPAQLGAALAAIHSIDGAAIKGVPAPGGDPALAACEVWESQLDEIGEPLPGVEAGLRWLRLHAPPAAAERLVHGDFRLGNLIVDENGLAAVIDWELCHSGDPAEDIGWLCIRSWRFGNDEFPVAGLGLLEPLLMAYEAAGGTRPEPERLRWWGAMGNVKWAVICARQAADHLSGSRPSAELASLGRRICEPEYDLLAELSWSSPKPRPSTDPVDPGQPPMPVDSSASRPGSTGLAEGA
jgi:aminoglycoside phosphotransferase (APT) family kinase protein